MDSGVEFVAVDNPHANKLTVHILAAVAQHEREIISARTSAALKAAKARGKRLGNPKLSEARRHAAAARKNSADRGPHEDAGKPTVCGSETTRATSRFG
jgi:DNA invertase Pin-like site-specific DNA recombinase